VATLEQLIARQLGAEAEAIAQRELHGYEAVRHLALSGAAKNDSRNQSPDDGARLGRAASTSCPRGAIRWKHEKYDLHLLGSVPSLQLVLLASV